jgi:hypothetical protein
MTEQKKKTILNEVRKWIAEQLFNLAYWVDWDTLQDICCDIATDNEYGYCPNCEGTEWEGC